MKFWTQHLTAYEQPSSKHWRLQEVAKLGPTMWFGETSLLKREPRPNNVVSETAVDLLLLDRTDLVNILGPLQTILDAQAANFGPSSVKKVPEEPALANACKHFWSMHNVLRSHSGL